MSLTECTNIRLSDCPREGLFDLWGENTNDCDDLLIVSACRAKTSATISRSCRDSMSELAECLVRNCDSFETVEEACIDPLGFTPESTKSAVRNVSLALGVVCGLFLLDFLCDKRCCFWRSKKATKPENENKSGAEEMEEGGSTSKFGILALHKFDPEENLKKKRAGKRKKSSSGTTMKDSSTSREKSSGEKRKQDQGKDGAKPTDEDGSQTFSEEERPAVKRMPSARLVAMESERTKSVQRIGQLQNHMDSIIEWHQEQSVMIRSTHGNSEIKSLDQSRHAKSEIKSPQQSQHASIPTNRSGFVATSISLDGSLRSHGPLSQPSKRSQDCLPNEPVAVSQGGEHSSPSGQQISPLSQESIKRVSEERGNGSDRLVKEYTERDRREREIVRRSARRRNSLNSEQGNVKQSKDKQNYGKPQVQWPNGERGAPKRGSGGYSTSETEETKSASSNCRSHVVEVCKLDSGIEHGQRYLQKIDSGVDMDRYLKKDLPIEEKKEKLNTEIPLRDEGEQNYFINQDSAGGIFPNENPKRAPVPNKKSVSRSWGNLAERYRETSTDVINH